jgi:hypothetical protein
MCRELKHVALKSEKICIRNKYLSHNTLHKNVNCMLQVKIYKMNILVLELIDAEMNQCGNNMVTGLELLLKSKCRDLFYQFNPTYMYSI